MSPDQELGRWLGWRQVHELTGLGRTTAWRMRRSGDFPDPVPISPGRVAWRERDIIEWTATRGQPLARRRPRALEDPAPAPPPQRLPWTALVPTSAKETRRKQPVEEAVAGSSDRVRAKRRLRTTVVEGQLGFDF